MHPFLITIVAIILCFGDANSTSSERVEYLPGFQGPLPFHLETDYVGVGENEDVQLFYYFVESESNPKDDPLMLWLTGGESCSSLSGLLFEIGSSFALATEALPHLNKTGHMEFAAVPYNGSFPNLKLRQYSWTQMASIIFLDIPVGTGFSYARTARASHSIDQQYADQAYEFMRKWLDSHPEFVSNLFYIGGDSHAGIPLPGMKTAMSLTLISSRHILRWCRPRLCGGGKDGDDGGIVVRWRRGDDGSEGGGVVMMTTAMAGVWPESSRKWEMTTPEKMERRRVEVCVLGL
ncbi:serine carboxypeptidase-like protein 13 isoform X1 [Tanacetum coccineum]